MFRRFHIVLLLFLALTISSLSISPAVALKDGLYMPGKLVIAGKPLRCGKVKTLVSRKYWRAAGSIPGLIGLNPRKLKKYSRIEQWFIYTHECGHQYKGRSERKADCWAARTGHRQGWLKRSDLRRICATLRNDPAKNGYPSGKTRCRIMKRCF
jgi:hypothetical protein